MGRRTAIFAAISCVGAFGLPVSGASAASGNSNSADARQCAAERAIDRAAFKATYGKNPMRRCARNDVAASASAFAAAVQACRAQRAANPTDFRTAWGSNTPNANSRGIGRNALGKCISAAARSFHGGAPSS